MKDQNNPVVTEMSWSCAVKLPAAQNLSDSNTTPLLEGGPLSDGPEEKELEGQAVQESSEQATTSRTRQ